MNIPRDHLIELSVDGHTVQVPQSATVMQACSLANVDVPRFCYHDRLGIAGNCRMCLVQVNEGPKLVASCAAPVMPNMRIVTGNEQVRRAREGVMEFLLANHPLDCPICDQGGECDLQDEAMAFGSDRSRFQIKQQDKRAVEDKDIGPLIKTSMNRCIQCTRCVRFANEIAGVQELGTTGRGNDMQIGTYIQKVIASPVSGNIIDLCPVGALTSKPYAFRARPWELRSTDSIDAMDAMGASIKIDSRGMQVMRVLPRLNEAINEEWIGDKTRFACDGLTVQRLVHPMVRAADGVLYPCSWTDALALVAERMQSAPLCRRTGGDRVKAIRAVVGKFADVESTFSLVTLMRNLGAPPPLIEERPLALAEGRGQPDGSTLDVEGRHNLGIAKEDVARRFFEEMRFTTPIACLGDADAILMVGTDLEREAPLLHVRLRSAWLARSVAIASIGGRPGGGHGAASASADNGSSDRIEAPLLASQMYAVSHLGQDVRAVEELARALEGKDAAAASLGGAGQVAPNVVAFAKALQSAKRPAIIVGQGAVLSHPRGRRILEGLLSIARSISATLAPEDGSWSGINFLPIDGGRTGALMLGCQPPLAVELPFLPPREEATQEGREEEAGSVVYLLNADDYDDRLVGGPSTFVIYQGHHGDVGALRANVILPGAAFTEKDASYVNLEGRLQMTRAAVPPPGEARPDWMVLRALCEFLGHTPSWDTQAGLHARLVEEHPEKFTAYNEIPPSALIKSMEAITFVGEGGVTSGDESVSPTHKKGGRAGGGGRRRAREAAAPEDVEEPLICSSVKDYYMSDCISRNSATMAKCSAAFTERPPPAPQGST